MSCCFGSAEEIWTGLSDGFWCHNPKVSVHDEVPLTASSVCLAMQFTLHHQARKARKAI